MCLTEKTTHNKNRAFSVFNGKPHEEKASAARLRDASHPDLARHWRAQSVGGGETAEMARLIRVAQEMYISKKTFKGVR